MALTYLWSTSHPDVTTYYVQEAHNALPSNGRVLEAVLALVRGEECQLPATLPEPVGILDGLRHASLVQQVAELRARFDAGRLLREDLAKVFFAR